jgi:hypothetical protein
MSDQEKAELGRLVNDFANQLDISAEDKGKYKQLMAKALSEPLPLPS